MRGSIDLSPSGDGRRIAIIFAVGMLMFGVGGCSPDHSTQESTIPRTALDGTPRVIRLSNGACLDASRLPPPWILDPPTAPTDISFHATYAALRVPQPDLVRMAQRPGDEQRRVLVDAGRLTAVNRDFYGVAPPARLNYLILNHQFLTPIPSPWSPQENRLSLSAFHINDENLYVSADRIIQCRDHLPTPSWADKPNPYAQCGELHPDKGLSFGFSVASDAVTILPEIIAKVHGALDSMTRPCGEKEG